MTLKTMIRSALPVSLQGRLKAQLRSWGYTRAPREPVDFIGLSVKDPLDASERAMGAPALTEVAIDRCRCLSMLGFAFTADARNPFVETAALILHGGLARYEESPLRAYFESFQPRTIRDVYGWEAASAALDQPALCGTAPWQGTPGLHNLKSVRQTNARDNSRYGGLDPKDDSHLAWGPVSPGKGELEFRRIRELARSIDEHGYRPSNEPDGHITAHLLVADAGAVVLVYTGLHRMAVLAAMGWKRIPVVIRGVAPVRREAVDQWPAVRSGAFTRRQALEAFDVVYEGRRAPGPGCALSWAVTRPRSVAAE